MKRNVVISILGLGTLLPVAVGFFVVLGLQPQAPRAKESPSTLAQTAEELRTQYGAVRFQREEQWEDRFIVRWSAATAALMPRIFQVQSRRFDVAGDFVTTNTSTGIPTMYLATSPDASRIYKLGGFDLPEQNFNRLVTEGPPQKIGTEGEAESRGLMCAEIVYVLSPEWWVNGASNAKLQAAKHFFNNGHEDGLQLAEKWWKSFKGDRAAINVTTTKANGAFFVNLPVFWAPVEGHSIPEIRVYRIEVSESGTCHMNEPVVYR